MLMVDQESKTVAIHDHSVMNVILDKLWPLSRLDLDLRCEVLSCAINITSGCHQAKKEFAKRHQAIQSIIACVLHPKTNVKICYLIYRLLTNLVIDCHESRTAVLRCNILFEFLLLVNKYFKNNKHHRIEFILKFFIGVSMCQEGIMLLVKEKDLLKTILGFTEQKWDRLEPLRLTMILIRNITFLQKGQLLASENVAEYLVGCITRYHQTKYSELQMYITSGLLSLMYNYPQKYKLLFKKGIAQNELKELIYRLSMYSSEEKNAQTISDWIDVVRTNSFDDSASDRTFVEQAKKCAEEIL
ncbi:Rttn, partial [Acrasis kona]